LNKIPALKLRLADEDEIIGTDWAQMGERAYGYLPMDEEQARSQQFEEETRRHMEDNADLHGRQVQLDEHVNGILNEQNRNSSGIDLHLNTVPSGQTTSIDKAEKKGFLRNLRKLGMSRSSRNKSTNNRVTGAFLMEEPVVLNYGQTDKELGSSSSKELDAVFPRTPATIHHTSTQIRTTDTRHLNELEMVDMTQDHNVNHSDTDDEPGPSTVNSSSDFSSQHDADTIVVLGRKNSTK
jgi:hypothetical protein